MAINSSNLVFIYRNNDSESYEVAIRYLEVYDLDVSQLIGIDCSSDEVLASYNQFKTEVEDPISSAISSMSDVYVIVLGYNVPAGFYDGEDIISSTSRISRINHVFSKKVRSILYDRKIFARFSSTDANTAIICSRIDASTKDYALSIIRKSEEILNQHFVYGAFFLDPYSNITADGAAAYTEALEDFGNNILPNLYIDNCITAFSDPYIDPFHPMLVNDTFYWGWFTNRGSASFFRDTHSSRLFFYNADYDSGYTLKASSPVRWMQLSIEAGYASSAGAMSNPTVSAFLTPEPFFVALKNGATLGEAYLFANPYFDWTISFVGDPLLSIAFPDKYLGEQ